MVECILIFEILPFYCEQVKHKDFVWEFEDFAAKTRLSKKILSFENQNIKYEHFIKYDFKYKIVRKWLDFLLKIGSIYLFRVEK